MDAEDLAAAFEPHATSKIKTSKDLRGISTLGFRGEALASIASVAQVKAISRTKDSAAANCLEIDCGKKGNVAPCSADYGTTIQVRDLFYKLPARRKFLKTANTEMGHIIEHFTRIALARCDLDMTLVHNGRELYRLSSGQGLRQRIAWLFCSEIAEDLLETESEEKGLHIFAMMGRPSNSRTSSKFQYIFLNGRFIRDKFISHAVKEAYRGTLEQSRYPIIFVFIEMPYEDYDVNVHPTKIEVRFYNANLVHSQVLGCLREKLLSTDLDTQAKLPLTTGTAKSQDAALTARYRGQQITDAMAEFFKKHKPIRTQEQPSPAPRAHLPAPHPAAQQVAERPAAPAAPPISTGPGRFLQIHDSYIVTQTEEGFIIIDQHALHERILYENLRKRTSAGKLESQRLLIPESFEVTDTQVEAIKSNGELMEKLGIELAPFGPRTLAIQAFPTLLAKADPLDFVQDLADLLDHKDAGIDAESLLDEVLNMAACKAAIKAGQKLSDREIEQLLADKDLTEYSSHCPHGRPTAIRFSISDLEKQFKRT
jgi:DNA mismatch repair protein MutL